MSSLVYIVIPCFNEAKRLNRNEVNVLLADQEVRIVFVDDGSTDTTLDCLRELQVEHPQRVEVLPLPKNLGKAEAVRNGLLHAVSSSAIITGYLDADFATPASEMLRLIDTLRGSPDTRVLLASRWLHLGSRIERHLFRHYTGRIFATLASMVLNLKVYDTQCGAKLFRVDADLARAIKQPFLSRWAFDVELIGRLRRTHAEKSFLEVPLNTWIDVAGSKMSLLDMFRATLELLLIWRQLHRNR